MCSRGEDNPGLAGATAAFGRKPGLKMAIVKPEEIEIPVVKPKEATALTAGEKILKEQGGIDWGGWELS